MGGCLKTKDEDKKADKKDKSNKQTIITKFNINYKN